MKTFCQWLKEDAPTNSVSTGAIRGAGNVTGIPGGDYSSYADNNLADQSKSSGVVQGMVDYHMGMHDDIDDDQTTLDSADAKTDQLGSRGRGSKGKGSKGNK